MSLVFLRSHSYHKSSSPHLDLTFCCWQPLSHIENTILDFFLGCSLICESSNNSYPNSIHTHPHDSRPPIYSPLPNFLSLKPVSHTTTAIWIPYSHLYIMRSPPSGTLGNKNFSLKPTYLSFTWTSTELHPLLTALTPTNLFLSKFMQSLAVVDTCYLDLRGQ